MNAQFFCLQQKFKNSKVSLICVSFVLGHWITFSSGELGPTCLILAAQLELHHCKTGVEHCSC